ncbi:hypothetical protein [Lactiplantibacillus mudanjiangensis]|uniref:Uncharacterized protein n=1 Tax=Lactiplantibacillus mudanjiangensis TaxID=1296538 RepID=A0A660DXF7_9LACO|nr:hypothetical protein [Lactiplantibacillus mudanjiangensis]VDG23680.1 hypothetical protein MUDAN_IGPPGNFN_02217 [Lactiplantibacillus mudanjiangensis]VDG27823.1 hypothetical protein MUDAN_MDHGFNIF_02646 [Lactiplantibacillus mudanjiangensis]
MDQKDFIEQFSEKIDQVVNEDAVRAETLHRELDNGQIQGLIDDSIAMGAHAYRTACSNGFSVDQAFVIAMNQIGFTYHE